MGKQTLLIRLGVAAAASVALGTLGGPALGAAPGEAADPAEIVSLYDLYPQTVPRGTTTYVHGFYQSTWAVTAVRPRFGEPTLGLYDGADVDVDNQLAKSKLPGDAVEFTVVYDPYGDFGGSYYPHVKSKGGTSSIELSEAYYSLLPGQSPEDYLAYESVVRIHPLSSLEDGVEYELTAGGADSGDIDMYLMAKPDESDVVGLSRSEAIASAESQPAGGTESLTFTADDAQDYALVIIQESGKGNVTVTLDAAS